MSRDISLLPEEMRRKEEQKRPPANNKGAGNGFHLPEPPKPPDRPLKTPPSVKPVPAVPPSVEKPLEFKEPAAKSVHNGSASAAPKKVNGNGRKNGNKTADTPIPPSKKEIPAASLHVPSASVQKVGGVSLIPGELRGAAAARGWKRWLPLAGVLFSLAVIVAGWFGLRSWVVKERSVVNELLTRNDTLRQQLQSENDALRLYESAIRRARAVSSLLDNHRDWSAFFRLTEKQTLPNVIYESLTVDAVGSAAMAVTAPNVRTAAEQIAAWRAELGTANVETSGLANTVDELGVIQGVRFDLRLKLDPKIFITPPADEKPAQAAPSEDHVFSAGVLSGAWVF